MDYHIVKKNKKSFALLLTILLLVCFSFLSLYIIEIKTFQDNTQTKQYQTIQAKFHLSFLKNFIKNLDLNNKNEACVNSVKLDNSKFDIRANISYISNKSDCKNSSNPSFDSNYTNGAAIVDIYVKSKSSIFKIKLHERFLKKL